MKRESGYHYAFHKTPSVFIQAASGVDTRPDSNWVAQLEQLMKVFGIVLAAVGALLGIPLAFLQYQKTKVEIRKLKLEEFKLKLESQGAQLESFSTNQVNSTLTYAPDSARPIARDHTSFFDIIGGLVGNLLRIISRSLVGLFVGMVVSIPTFFIYFAWFGILVFMILGWIVGGALGNGDAGAKTGFSLSIFSWFCGSPAYRAVLWVTAGEEFDELKASLLGGVFGALMGSLLSIILWFTRPEWILEVPRFASASLLAVSISGLILGVLVGMFAGSLTASAERS